MEESQNELEILLSESQEFWVSLQTICWIFVSDSFQEEGLEERSNSGSTLKRKRLREDVDFPTADASCDESVLALSQYMPQSPRPPAPRSVGAPPIRPTFDSGWQIPLQQIKPGSTSGKLQPASTKSNPFAIKLDAKGKPLVPVQVGSRRRAKF